MAGYWNKPEETARALPGDALHTGDVGYMDDDGWFYIVDRKKDQINVGGYKVWPREVEDVLYEHEAVREAAVVGVPDPYRGETVKAYVSLKTGGTATAEELAAHCQQRLAAYKYPRQVEIIDELPKTVTGKILRRELRAQATIAGRQQQPCPACGQTGEKIPSRVSLGGQARPGLTVEQMPQTWRGAYEGNPEYVGQLRRQWETRQKLEDKYEELRGDRRPVLAHEGRYHGAPLRAGDPLPGSPGTRTRSPSRQPAWRARRGHPVRRVPARAHRGAADYAVMPCWMGRRDGIIAGSGR